MSNFFIPDPCHENWNKMTPQEQGRHCAVCSKVVVDFTQKKDEEINDILSNTTGKVCGHFKIEQLNQEAQMKVFRQPGNLLNRNWKYFALATLGFFAFNKKTEAQKIRGKVAPMRGDVAPVEYHNTNTSITSLYGTVRLGNGNPAGGAIVVVSSGGIEIARTTTIANGTYSIKIQPGKISGQKVDIMVTYDNVASKNIYDLGLTKATNRLNISLEEEMYMLKGEVQYVAPPKNAEDKIDTVVIDTVKEAVVIPKDKNEPEVICRYQVLPQGSKYPKDSITRISTLQQVQTVAIDSTRTTDNTKNWADPQAAFNVCPEDIVSTIYPNPAGTYATVYCNRQTTYKIELFDEKGALKLTKAFYGDRTELDVSGFARGNYFVLVRDEEGHKNMMKLVKQ